MPTVKYREKCSSKRFKTSLYAFKFAKIICHQDTSLYLASLDVDSLLLTYTLMKPSIHVIITSYLKITKVFTVLTKI